MAVCVDAHQNRRLGLVVQHIRFNLFKHPLRGLPLPPLLGLALPPLGRSPLPPLGAALPRR